MTSDRPISPWRVVWKGLLLFVAFNLLIALFPLRLGRISVYNGLVPGRLRLPFGENQRESYNLSLYDLDAMLASHAVSARKPADELRVVVLGDSSIWGTLLTPEQTLPGQLDARLAPDPCDGRTLRVYNLGYPTLSLTKDLLLLQRALDDLQPDLIVWAVTLESFTRDQQAASPIMANNPTAVQRLEAAYDVTIDLPYTEPNLLDLTLLGQRRPLADWFRLQAYGFLWASTGIDQYYPATYTPAAIDLEADATYHGWEGPDFPPDALALDLLAAGLRAANQAQVPLLLVNEPVLISDGENSDLRYNFYYPRWAYDQYREILAAVAGALALPYADLWDAAEPGDFTNSAIHLTPAAVAAVADELAPTVRRLACAGFRPLAPTEAPELPPDWTPGPGFGLPQGTPGTPIAPFPTPDLTQAPGCPDCTPTPTRDNAPVPFTPTPGAVETEPGYPIEGGGGLESTPTLDPILYP